MPEPLPNLKMPLEGEIPFDTTNTCQTHRNGSAVASFPDPSLLKQRQRQKGEVLAAFFDSLADKWERYRGRNTYYHRTQNALFRACVHPGSSVLELGCATGDLLALMGVNRGVGVDISPRMVEKARRKYPQLELIEADAVFFDTQERFDFILLNNLLEYVEDIQGLFRNCRRLLKPRGRILISSLNPLWTPVLKMGLKLGLCTPDTVRNFITGKDTANLLELNGFEVVKLMRRTLIPKKIPLLAPLVNLLAAQVPLLRRLCITEFLVARPTGSVEDYSVSVIVPCYNEAGNIEACVRRVPRMGCHTEVIVVDDGSEDGTADLVRPDLNPAVEVRRIAYTPNRGKLHAVRTGFESAHGDILMILDADMTVPPEDLHNFYEPLREGLADFINGTRLIYPFAGNSMKLQNFFGNKLFGVLVSWLTGIHLSDTLCGTKAFFREDYRRFSTGYDLWGDFDWLFGAAQNSGKILEVPIHYEERKAGQSKMKALRHTWGLLKACWFGFWRFKYPVSSVGAPRYALPQDESRTVSKERTVKAEKSTMLKEWLAHPLTRGCDIDDPRTTELRRSIIRKKVFLRRIYQEWYAAIVKALPACDGPVLELGSGAGFLRDYIPGLITSEIIAIPDLSLVLDAHAMPFSDGSLRAIVMTNVLHHLTDSRRFFADAGRCVKESGAILMIEPWVTRWSRLVYTRFHHEPFDTDTSDWGFPQTGPLSGANGALPWILFARDRVRFEREFPMWQIQTIRPIMPFRYLISGGVSLRSFMPGWSFGFWRGLENWMARWMNTWGMFACIVLTRTPHPDHVNPPALERVRNRGAI